MNTISHQYKSIYLKYLRSKVSPTDYPQNPINKERKTQIEMLKDETASNTEGSSVIFLN